MPRPTSLSRRQHWRLVSTTPASAPLCSTRLLATWLRSYSVRVERGGPAVCVRGPSLCFRIMAATGLLIRRMTSFLIRNYLFAFYLSAVVTCSVCKQPTPPSIIFLHACPHR